MLWWFNTQRRLQLRHITLNVIIWNFNGNSHLFRICLATEFSLLVVSHENFNKENRHSNLFAWKDVCLCIVTNTHMHNYWYNSKFNGFILHSTIVIILQGFWFSFLFYLSITPGSQWNRKFHANKLIWCLLLRQTVFLKWDRWRIWNWITVNFN